MWRCFPFLPLNTMACYNIIMCNTTWLPIHTTTQNDTHTHTHTHTHTYQSLPAVEGPELHNLLGLFDWAAWHQRQLVQRSLLKELQDLVLEGRPVRPSSVLLFRGQVVPRVLVVTGDRLLFLALPLRAHVLVWGQCLPLPLDRLLLRQAGPAGELGEHVTDGWGGRWGCCGFCFPRGERRCGFLAEPGGQRGGAAAAAFRLVGISSVFAALPISAVGRFFCIAVVCGVVLIAVFFVSGCLSLSLGSLCDVHLLRVGGFPFLALRWTEAGIVWWSRGGQSTCCQH